MSKKKMSVSSNQTDYIDLDEEFTHGFRNQKLSFADKHPLLVSIDQSFQLQMKTFLQDNQQVIMKMRQLREKVSIYDQILFITYFKDHEQMLKTTKDALQLCNQLQVKTGWSATTIKERMFKKFKKITIADIRKSMLTKTILPNHKTNPSIYNGSATNTNSKKSTYFSYLNQSKPKSSSICQKLQRPYQDDEDIDYAEQCKEEVVPSKDKGRNLFWLLNKYNNKKEQNVKEINQEQEIKKNKKQIKYQGETSKFKEDKVEKRKEQINVNQNKGHEELNLCYNSKTNCELLKQQRRICERQKMRKMLNQFVCIYKKNDHIIVPISQDHSYQEEKKKFNQKPNKLAQISQQSIHVLNHENTTFSKNQQNQLQSKCSSKLFDPLQFQKDQVQAKIEQVKQPIFQGLAPKNICEWKQFQSQNYKQHQQSINKLCQKIQSVPNDEKTILIKGQLINMIQEKKQSRDFHHKLCKIIFNALVPGQTDNQITSTQLSQQDQQYQQSCNYPSTQKQSISLISNSNPVKIQTSEVIIFQQQLKKQSHS